MRKVSLALVAALFTALMSLTAPVYAQTPTPPPPDLARFGYPTVAATRTVQPTETATITAGTQSVTVTAGSYANPVRFEFLTGDTGSWQTALNDPSQTVIATHAFRVTDLTTNQLVGRPNNPLQYSIADPRLSAAASIYATSAATPSALNKLTGVTFADQKLSRTYTSNSAGWIVTIPAAQVKTGDDALARTAGLLALTAAFFVIGGGYIWLRSRTARRPA